MNGKLKKYSRIVVKIGSSLVTDTRSDLNREWLDTLVDDIAALAQQDAEILIVSSGAIALGRSRMRSSHPDIIDAQLSLQESQAAAAVGQIALSSAYDRAFEQHGIRTAQVLLTIDDTETRRRYLNAKATIATLLDWHILPIINENDTVATSEIRYGDNDRLAARVASMVGADLLILLSDVEGLYSAPPAQDPDAKMISEVPILTPEILAMAGDAASTHSRGGMKTKIEAARIATESGCEMVIASGRHLHALKRVDTGGSGTWFRSNETKHNARKKWIAAGLHANGKIQIDSGALLALESGNSLLPAGVFNVEGTFERGDTVLVVSPNGQIIGRGIVEYDVDEAREIIGLRSDQIREILGPSIRPELIHRNNLTLIATTQLP